MCIEKESNKEVAVKILSKMFLAKTDKVKSVFRERDILNNSTDCKFIPEIYHTFMDQEYLYIVMEYMNGGTMQQKLKLVNGVGFKRDLVKFYAAQIVIALGYLQL